MSSTSEAIIHLIRFELEKGEAVQTLQQIEISMRLVYTEARTVKTIGNVISIMGTVAAPFTVGLSLVATGLGILVNVTSNFEESSQLNSLLKKAQNKIEKLSKFAQKIIDLTINWGEVVLTLCNTGIPLIKKMLSNMKIIEYIPQQLLTKTITQLQLRSVKIVTRYSIGLTEITVTETVITMTKQVSSEVGEHLTKQLGKKLILATFLGVCLGVAIDLFDIIRIWNSGEPEAIKMIQGVIRDLLKEDDDPN